MGVCVQRVLDDAGNQVQRGEGIRDASCRLPWAQPAGETVRCDGPRQAAGDAGGTDPECTAEWPGGARGRAAGAGPAMGRSTECFEAQAPVLPDR